MAEIGNAQSDAVAIVNGVSEHADTLSLNAETGSKKLSASEKRKLRAKAKKLADRAER